MTESNRLTIQCRKEFEKFILKDDPKALLTVKNVPRDDEYAWIEMHRMFEYFRAGWKSREQWCEYSAESEK